MDVHSWLTGRRWVSLPFTDYCAPLCGDNGSLDQLSGELVRLFRNEVRFRASKCAGSLPPQPLVQAQTHFVMHTLELDAEAEKTSGASTAPSGRTSAQRRKTGYRLYGEKISSTCVPSIPCTVSPAAGMGFLSSPGVSFN